MTTLTEGRRAVEFILSEANGTRSRENGVAKQGEVLKAGTVVEFDGTKLVACSGIRDTAGDLVTPAAGIVLHRVDATAADAPVAYLARDAEVKEPYLTYPALSSALDEKAACNRSLEDDLGIIVRREF